MRTPSGGLRDRLRSHPVIGDSLLAILLAVLSLWTAEVLDPGQLRQLDPPVVVRHPTDAVSSALIVLTCLPVALRRRWPFLMLAAAQLPQFALAVQGPPPGTSLVAPLVLVYTIAAYRGLALSVLGAVLAYLGFVLVFLIGFGADRWGELVVLFIVTASTWQGGRSRRLRRAYLAELEDRAERLERARDADRRAARVEERSRIARELHDVVAHHVSVMTVQAAAARKVLVANPEAAGAALSAIEEMGRTAMAEMRNIVGVLRMDGEEGGERAPQPGMQDLPALIEQMREAGLRTQLWIEGERQPLPPGVDLAAYRLIQEALTNSLRHAGPSARAWVTVRQEPGELIVHVEDDGLGAASELRRPPDRRPGHGLVGIRERVALYGGVLRIGPRQGGGFEVRARFPLKD